MLALCISDIVYKSRLIESKFMHDLSLAMLLKKLFYSTDSVDSVLFFNTFQHCLSVFVN